MTETEKRDREVDAEVAEKVFGWEVRDKWKPDTLGRDDRTFLVSTSGILEGWWQPDGSFIPHADTNLPNYTTDPAADYEVLQVILGWPRALQSDAVDHLRAEWIDRGHDEWPELGYEPGDYARSALAAIREREGGGE